MHFGRQVILEKVVKGLWPERSMEYERIGCRLAIELRWYSLCSLIQNVLARHFIVEVIS
jgi:hypothetical protein